MDTNPYSRFKVDDLILRDYLAADRTALANERTMLSYVRTGLAFAASGAALVRFFDSTLAEITGWLLIPVGIVVLVFGMRRYIQVKRRIDRVGRE